MTKSFFVRLCLHIMNVRWLAIFLFFANFVHKTVFLCHRRFSW